MASIHEHATTQILGSGIDRLSGRQLRHAVTGYFARYRFACFSSWVLLECFDPDGTCRETVCCRQHRSRVVLGAIDLARDSRDEPGIPISNRMVARRSVPVFGVLLASARRCVSR
jgi:hypothetical protein